MIVIKRSCNSNVRVAEDKVLFNAFSIEINGEEFEKFKKLLKLPGKTLSRERPSLGDPARNRRPDGCQLSGGEGMTADDFYMNVKSTVVDISVQDGGMKAEAEIYIEDFARALIKTNDNLDMLNNFIKDELKNRAVNAWDESIITDEELAHFKKVLEWIL